MVTQVLMPALSPTMTEGKIARWLKSEGDPVHSGDVLAEIETDKATMEVEAVDEGVLAKIVIPEGTDHVAVNTPIAVIAGDGEEVALPDTAPAANGHQQPAPEAPRARPVQPAPAPAAGPRPPGGERISGPDPHHDGARGAARRDGRGDAARRKRVSDRRGGRRIPGRLQGQPGLARGIRGAPGYRHADYLAGFHRPRRGRAPN